jgi:hypothetical protein
VLPEVVYAYGLKEAIDKGFLKKVVLHGYANTRTDEFVDTSIEDFLKESSALRPEGLLPKLAFFAAIDELTGELKPAVERALSGTAFRPRAFWSTWATTNHHQRRHPRIQSPRLRRLEKAVHPTRQQRLRRLASAYSVNRSPRCSSRKPRCAACAPSARPSVPATSSSPTTTSTP